jgi:hypothetical protein
MERNTFDSFHEFSGLRDLMMTRYADPLSFQRHLPGGRGRGKECTLEDKEDPLIALTVGLGLNVAVPITG